MHDLYSAVCNFNEPELALLRSVQKIFNYDLHRAPASPIGVVLHPLVVMGSGVNSEDQHKVL